MGANYLHVRTERALPEHALFWKSVFGKQSKISAALTQELPGKFSQGTIGCIVGGTQDEAYKGTSLAGVSKT